MAFSVLIADDEPLEREALRDIVDGEQNSSIVVYTARSGTEALSILEQETIDVAFLDIRMPGRSGLEVAEELRRRESEIAIVFISAFDYFEYARSALRLRAEDYLVKPIEDEVVRRILHRLVSRSQGERADRFSEVARFLEHELLDDVISGDIDRVDLAPAFELLGYGDVTGSAILVRPDLSQYPFTLETDAQRRTVVHRALRIVKRSVGTVTARFLERIHPDIGYLIALSSDRSGDPPFLPDMMESARHAATDQLALPITVIATDEFEGVEQMSHLIRDARRKVNSFPEPENRPRGPLGVPPIGPAAGREDAAATIERYMLRALVRSDTEEMRRASESLWELLTADGTIYEDLPSVRDYLTRTLGFLVRSARNRGLATEEERSLLLAANHATRQELRVAFFAETERLVCSQAQAQSQWPVDTFSRRVADYLNSNYYREVGLSDLAEHLGISESHCSREVSRHFGRTFRRMLREIRLQAAQQLLSDPARAIRDVAERSGFRDPNYFSRVFQESFGMTPREYRELVL
ncbi:MAG: response regulator [Alkalispirochaeta sp.]